MSEIFEALRKAQRDANSRDGQPGATPQDAPDVRDPEPLASPLPLPRPAPAPPPPPRRRRRLLQALTSGWGANGHAPPDVVSAASLQPGTQIAEQFRVLRTRLQTAGPGTLMITSALDSEGKTMCAAHLAVSLAMSLDAQVVLVDADLRHPSAGEIFGVHERPGLVDYFNGDASWSDCIRPTTQERLSVIPAGSSSTIATELLGSERMTGLIAEIKSRFPRHYIIFDAPPLLLTADPLVLAQHMDRVLLVVRANITPRAAVLKAIETLGSERFFGIVFNGATEHPSHYYSGGYYYR